MDDSPKPTLIEVSPEAVERLKDETRAVALQTITDVLTAYADGEINEGERDALLDKVVRGVTDAAEVFLDAVIVLPSPGEEISDLAIDQGMEALRPLLAPAIVRIGKALGDLREALDRDPRAAPASDPRGPR